MAFDHNVWFNFFLLLIESPSFQCGRLIKFDTLHLLTFSLPFGIHLFIALHLSLHNLRVSTLFQDHARLFSCFWCLLSNKRWRLLKCVSSFRRQKATPSKSTFAIGVFPIFNSSLRLHQRIRMHLSTF